MGFRQVNYRRDEAPFGRCRAAVGGRLLRLPAATERGERAVETDAAGRAVPELHAGGESRRIIYTKQVVERGTASRQGYGITRKQTQYPQQPPCTS